MREQIKIECLYKNKKVLVLGGAGFIGSNLSIRLVKLGAKVSIVDAFFKECGGNIFNLNEVKSAINLYCKDVNRFEGIGPLLRNAEIIFNCMGCTNHLKSIRNPIKDFRYNVLNHLNFLSDCKEYNPSLKIIYLGSRSQYGRALSNPIKEEHPLSPLEFHSVHKTIAEFYHRLFSLIFRLDTRVLRITNVYGPRQDMRRGNAGIVNSFIREIMDGRKARIFGNMNRMKDFLYVDDLIDVLLLIGGSEDDFGQIYNVGGKSEKIGDIAKAIIRILGRGSYAVVPMPKEIEAIDVGEVILDNSKIKKGFGWQPKFNLSKGITDTISYYIENKGFYW